MPSQAEAVSEPCRDCPPSSEAPRGSLRVSRWRVWFDDGSVRDGRTISDWIALPDDGVLGFVLFYEREGYRRIGSGNDYYWAFEGLRDTVYAHGNDTPESIERRYPNPIIKRGRWTDDLTIDLVNTAMAEAV